MVHADEGDLPCHREALRCVKADEKIGTHPWATCDGYKVRLLAVVAVGQRNDFSVINFGVHGGWEVRQCLVD